MAHCILTTPSRVVSKPNLGMPAKTDILEDSSLLLLHLARVAARFHAKLEGCEGLKARKITISTFYSIMESRINHALNGSSQAARLLGGTINSPERLSTDG